MGAEMDAVNQVLCLYGGLMLGFILLLGSLMFGLVLFWRRRVYGRNPPHTFEGDIAYIARNRRERLESLRKRRGRGR